VAHATRTGLGELPEQVQDSGLGTFTTDIDDP
jgi:hypothetical protein